MGAERREREECFRVDELWAGEHLYVRHEEKQCHTDELVHHLAEWLMEVVDCESGFRLLESQRIWK